MALGDLGAEVLRLDRATSVAAGSGMIPASPYASLDRNRRSMGIDLKHPRAAETVLDPVRVGRRAHRGLPARRGRAARHRTRRRARSQPAPRLRPHDRLGAGRADGPRRRPRHQLHRARRRPRAHRHRRWPAGPADQPGRRLRRRRPPARVRHPRRAARARAVRAGPGDRRRDGRRRGDADERVRRPQRDGLLVRRARHEPARRRRALLRRLRALPTASGSRSRATSRSSTPSSPRLLGPLGIELDPATQMDQSTWPGLKEQMAELFRTRTAGRVGRVLRRPRGVLRARCSR